MASNISLEDLARRNTAFKLQWNLHETARVKVLQQEQTTSKLKATLQTLVENFWRGHISRENENDRKRVEQALEKENIVLNQLKEELRIRNHAYEKQKNIALAEYIDSHKKGVQEIR